MCIFIPAEIVFDEIVAALHIGKTTISILRSLFLFSHNMITSRRHGSIPIQGLFTG
jgi:hypothetical protein